MNCIVGGLIAKNGKKGPPSVDGSLAAIFGSPVGVCDGIQIDEKVKVVGVEAGPAHLN